MKASGFYAAYDPFWWPSFTRVGDGTIAQSYGDGVELRSEKVLTKVAIASDAGALEAEVEMAQIEEAWGGPRVDVAAFGARSPSFRPSLNSPGDPAKQHRRGQRWVTTSTF